MIIVDICTYLDDILSVYLIIKSIKVEKKNIYIF